MEMIRPSEYQAIQIKQHQEFVVDGVKILSTETHVIDFPTYKMSNQFLSMWKSSMRSIMIENLDGWLDEVYLDIVAEV